jgi:hypothetical protein
MCRLPECTCDEYRGAVRRNVHAKRLREWRAEEKSMREEQAIFDRDESAALRADGYVDTTDEPDDGEEHLYAAGREWR